MKKLKCWLFSLFLLTMSLFCSIHAYEPLTRDEILQILLWSAFIFQCEEPYSHVYICDFNYWGTGNEYQQDKKKVIEKINKFKIPGCRVIINKFLVIMEGEQAVKNFLIKSGIGHDSCFIITKKSILENAANTRANNIEKRLLQKMNQDASALYDYFDPSSESEDFDLLKQLRVDLGLSSESEDFDPLQQLRIDLGLSSE